MATTLTDIETPLHDGTSRRGREIPALDPAHALADERGVKELVAFTREQSKKLPYVDAEGHEAGTWSDFLNGVTPEVAEAFLKDPSRFPEADWPLLYRPHVTLYLVFLRLFQRAQAELNGLTERHLDFYYRTVLGVKEREPEADRVHLTFELVKGAKEALVKAGTLASAGADSSGRDRVYATDRPVVVNRIQIAERRSVLVHRETMGFEDARRRFETIDNHPGKVPMVLLRIALGDPLPPYPDVAGPLTFELFQNLASQVSESEGFYLSLTEVRDLLRLEALLRKLSRPATKPEPPKPPPAETPAEAQAKAEVRAKIDAILRISDARERAHGGQPSPRKLARIVEFAAQIEAYFHTSLEGFVEASRQILSGAPDRLAWKRTDAILEGMYQARIRDERVDRLREIHEASPDAGLVPLLQRALDDRSEDEVSLLDRLAIFLTPAGLLAFKEARALALPRPADGDRWAAVHRLLEIAWRNRVGERPARIENWCHLYFHEDAAIGGARPVDEGAARWAPFGAVPEQVEAQRPTPVLGWAIASPLLALSEGERTITLELDIRSSEAPADPNEATIDGSDVEKTLRAGLSFQVSTAAGWAEPSEDATVIAGEETLPKGLARVRCTLVFESTREPIVPVPGAKWPALRLMLRPRWELNRWYVRYPQLSSLLVTRARLTVAVKGLGALALQNDEGPLDPKKPFLPFGRAPAVGSNLRIGHREIAEKPLDSLAFRFWWMAPPPSLQAHYEGWTQKDGAAVVKLLDPEKLTVEVSLIEPGTDESLLHEQRLFGEPTAGETRIPAAEAVKTPKVSEPTGALEGPLGKDLSTWPRFFQWMLDGVDFGHQAYPEIAARKAVELATAIANKTPNLDPKSYHLRPPYTPRLARLLVDYTSSREVSFAEGAEDAGPLGPRVFHVHPFGECDVRKEPLPEGISGGVLLLPRYDDDGELHLGLTGVAPPQSVTLLFRLAEGSADSDLPAPTVTWSILDGDTWVPLGSGVSLDETHGLTRSGVVEIALPAVAPSRRLPGDRTWIRASVARDVGAACDIVDIHPQAVSATFVDRGNAPAHYRSPLPEGSIQKLTPEVRGIARVHQPSPSWGGRPAEETGDLRRRVSERLRHKDRAVSTWDYERLILERFPGVYKARCIPASADDPGKVRVVIIPDAWALGLPDRRCPRAPASLLTEIAERLREETSAFSDVAVQNARYWTVRVRLAVRFSTTGNEAFYTRRLIEDLNRLLSPWASEEGRDIRLGGRIYASSIVDFVDRLDYVDYVARPRLFVGEDGAAPLPVPPESKGEVDFVAATAPDAVLVGAPDHVIDVLHDVSFDEERGSGIGFLKVGFDLVVGRAGE